MIYKDIPEDKLQKIRDRVFKDKTGRIEIAVIFNAVA